MLRWKEGSKLTTIAAYYLALEVTDKMVFLITTAKLHQLVLSAVQFVREKKLFSIGLGGLL